MATLTKAGWTAYGIDSVGRTTQIATGILTVNVVMTGDQAPADVLAPGTATYIALLAAARADPAVIAYTDPDTDVTSHPGAIVGFVVPNFAFYPVKVIGS